MTESKSLKKAVDSEVRHAEHEARTGDVKTTPQSEGGPAADQPKTNQPQDLPTGQRSHPTPG